MPSGPGVRPLNDPPSLPLEEAVARSVDARFTEIPRSFLEDEGWVVVWSGRWEFSESILRTEAGAFALVPPAQASALAIPGLPAPYAS